MSFSPSSFGPQGANFIKTPQQWFISRVRLSYCGCGPFIVSQDAIKVCLGHTFIASPAKYHVTEYVAGGGFCSRFRENGVDWWVTPFSSWLHYHCRGQEQHSPRRKNKDQRQTLVPSNIQPIVTMVLLVVDGLNVLEKIYCCCCRILLLQFKIT